MNKASSTQAYHVDILRQVRQAGHITRRELAAGLGVSLSLVSRATAELLDQGLIMEAGRSEPLGGRPADLLALARDAAYVVGVDAGGDVQRGVVIDLLGTVVAQVVEPGPLPVEYDAILAGLERFVHQAITTAGLPEHAILGLGVGLRGLVDPVEGTVYGGPETHAWADPRTGFRLLDGLATCLSGLEIAIDDSVRTLGLAEAFYGHGAGQRDFVYTLADGGLGMALMIDGRPYLGASRVTGEIGHLIIDGTSVPCYCGNTGCVERLASTEAILREVEQTLAQVPIQSMLTRPGVELTIASVIKAAEQGDKLAYRIVMEAGEYFGAALAVVLNLLGPRLIVMGGAMAASDVYLEAARRVMRLRALGLASRHVQLVRSSLDEFAGARGAATQALNRLFDADDLHNLAVRKARLSAAAGRVPEPQAERRETQ